jgi:hypothetical protein
MAMDAALLETPRAASRRALHVALWVVQGLLVLAFGVGGLMKLGTPLAELMVKMPWTADLPHLVRFIGAAELAGAIGMVLPSLVRIKPWLTSLAGAGLALVMVLAAGFHLARGEARVIGVNLVLGALASLVAWGRSRGAPIAARG